MRAPKTIPSFSRVRSYQIETTPILAYYDHQGLLMRIDGAGTVAEVWAKTQDFINGLEAKLKVEGAGEVLVS